MRALVLILVLAGCGGEGVEQRHSCGYGQSYEYWRENCVKDAPPPAVSACIPAPNVVCL